MPVHPCRSSYQCTERTGCHAEADQAIGTSTIYPQRQRFGSEERSDDMRSHLIETQLRTWLAAMNIRTIYIEPGSPWLPSEATPQRAIARITNGYIESFHARFREECLNREQLWTLTEARVVIEDWRWLYNNVRPHRSLGNITPRRFALDAYKQGSCSIRATPSLRPSLDLLYQFNFNINLSRLTLAVDQFT